MEYYCRERWGKVRQIKKEHVGDSGKNNNKAERTVHLMHCGTLCFQVIQFFGRCRFREGLICE